MGNMSWYKNSYRRCLVDMHIEDWNEEFLSEFDPQSYLDCMKRGNIKSAMIYLQSHVGLCNWPSKSGRVHKAFEKENKVKELIGLCRAEGLDAVGYYSLIFNNWAYEAHPEWRVVDPLGANSREPDSMFGFQKRYGIVCPNNMEYRAFLTEQFTELFGTYDIDGIFLDMAFWPTICICDSCRARYRKDTGRDFPRLAAVDFNDPDCVRLQLCREAWMSEFAHFAADECRRICPGIPVEHNNALLTISWIYACNGGAALASDFTGGDQYGGQYEQSVICKLMYEITNNQPFEYMTSRCPKLINEHTTTKSAQLMKLQNYITLAHHGAMLYIDAIDPLGTMHPGIYDRIGEAFRQSEPFEKYLSGKMVADVAVYFDMKSKFRNLPQDPDISSQDPGHLSTYPQLDALNEGSRALVAGNYQYTVIPDIRKEKILGKKAVIVTEASMLSDDEITFLADYVEKGGNIYISGNVNPGLAQKLLSLEFLGWTDWKSSYIAPTEAGQQYFGDMYTAKHPLSYTKSQMLVHNPAHHQVLATVTLPYTNPMDPVKFASIHSNPPGIATEYPAVVYGRYGKGRVLWSAGAFESTAARPQKDVFLNLFGLVYGGGSFLKSTAPECVQFTLFDDFEHSRLLLHAVNVQELEPFFRAGSFSVTLETDKPVSRVRILPGLEDLPFTFESGALSFEVKDMDLFVMIEVGY